MQPPLRVRHRFNADPEFRRRFVLTLLALFSVVGWGGLLITSDVLVIRGVEIEGGEHIQPTEAKAAVFQLLDARAEWRPWSPRHRWFFDEATLAEGLRTRWFAEQVQVERKPGSNIVRLIVKEQRVGLVVRTAEQYVEVDANGVVRRELDNEERLRIVQRMTGKSVGTMPMIVELPFIQEPLAVGYRLSVSVPDVRRWIALGGLLDERQLPFRYLAASDALLAAYTLYDQNGVAIYLDTSTSLESQINALDAYVKARAQKRKGVEPAREFIDLRIPGRVYLK
jgi:hypothetical protein